MSEFSLPPAPSDQSGAVKAWMEPVVIPTYLPDEPDRNPMFLENRVYQGSSGRVYPLPFTSRIATRAVPHTWQAAHLENEFVRVMILPEIGGRIHVGLDKVSGYDFFYRQNVIKPALVGLAGPWASGGVEFNWPQHHRPATFLPVAVQIESHADGSQTIWCQDRDPLTRLQGMHGVCLHPGKSYIELKVAGNTGAWLRKGDVGLDRTVVAQDRFITDNVAIQFRGGEMTIRTHGIPNHPTGQFPEHGFGNPNYITEQIRTYYFPLSPTENPQHIAVHMDNANHALPMGPIGLAVNGVVFFNPFDMGGQDATDMMDRCCGHPSPDGQYHYHKYPICVNSPWADEGKAHSPLLGWAFDGFPVYGPYEKADVMAKDIKGTLALNEFNMHFDQERGWHYHVTPGSFPYIIGGYWGTKDAKDGDPHRRPGGPGGLGGPPGPNNRPGGQRGPPPNGGGPGNLPPPQ